MKQGHEIPPRGLGRKKVPIYEFKCQECGNLFEFICFRSGEQHEVNCPSTFSSSSGKGLGLGGNNTEPSSCAPTGGFS
jgi:putative FmdB family regulatory protein